MKKGTNTGSGLSTIAARERLARLLIAVIGVMAALLVLAVWRSNEDLAVTLDVDRSSTLRFASLYIYGATHLSASNGATGASSATGASEPQSKTLPDWRTVFKTIDATRMDLRKRYPKEIAATDAAWNRFAGQLTTQGTVDWVTANTVREQANDLTVHLTGTAQQHKQQMFFVYAFSLAAMAFALPWAVMLFAEVRDNQHLLLTENAEQKTGLLRYEALLSTLPAGCFVFDAEGKVVLWNRAAQLLFGWESADVVGRRVSECFSQSAQASYLDEAVQQAIAGKKRENWEWRYDADPESVRYLLTSILPLTEADLGKSGGIGVSVDITALKQAEERLQSVLVGVRGIVWDAVVEEITTPPYFGWTVQIWNVAGAQQILPLDTENRSYIDAWMESRSLDQELLDRTSASAFREGRSGYTHEFRCHDRHGALRWLREDVHIEPITRGRWRVIGVCTDISARKEAEERLFATTAELERSNAALQDFANIASHDLKEPLRKIRTFGGMLVRKAENLSPEAQGHLDRMIAAVTRMQALIDGLMSYSRVATKGNLFERTDLNTVVKEVLNDLELVLEEAKARVIVAPLPTIYADAVQMRQLFQNLLSNSLKFYREGEPVCVEIGYEQRERKHIITIVDNGVGFAAKDAERIFEMFERLDGSGREGTGIGLAICRKIAERHGGTLTATGVPNVGAVFTLTLSASGPHT